MYHSLDETNPARNARTFDGQIIKPDWRPALVAYLMPTVCIIIPTLAILVPNDGVRFALTFGLIPAFFFGLYLAIKDHIRLISARYTIAFDHIEATAREDILNQATRRIPLAYIRDLTLHQSFVQSFFKVSNITVATTNGDKIILENLNDAPRTE